MAFATRYAPRRGQIPYWLIAVSVLGAVVGVLPVVAAVMGGAGDGTATAFASAPAGDYAIVSTPGETEDVIQAVSPGDASRRVDVARVQHLAGFSPVGTVSPDGRSLALVVVDAGTPARPAASLLVIDVLNGEVNRRTVDVDPRQPPVWTAGGGTIVVTRTAPSDGPLTSVQVLAVPTRDGDERVLETHEAVLGVYPVAFDGAGRLVSVVIDGHGSRAYRDGAPVALLSSQVTRDWKLSPDGTQLAFIESDVRAGLHYTEHVVALDGTPAADSQVLAQSAAGGQQLGVAWKPGADAPTFGQEPGSGNAAGGASAQSQAAAGFDVPLGFSADGQALAVQAWTGSSFTAPGDMRITLVEGDQRTALAGVNRFYGWAPH